MSKDAAVAVARLRLVEAVADDVASDGELQTMVDDLRIAQLHRDLARDVFDESVRRSSVDAAEAFLRDQ